MNRHKRQRGSSDSSDDEPHAKVRQVSSESCRKELETIKISVKVPSRLKVTLDEDDSRASPIESNELATPFNLSAGSMRASSEPSDNPTRSKQSSIQADSPNVTVDPEEAEINEPKITNAEESTKSNSQYNGDGNVNFETDSENSYYDTYAQWDWLETFEAFASVKETRIAECDVKLIRRYKIRPAFWIEMHEPSSETEDLGFKLFDRYGRVRREYTEHEVRKGTGVWGNELDYGDILLIESIRVQKPWRRKGVGARLMKAILNAVQRRSDLFFAFATPGCMEDVFGLDATKRGEIIEQETAISKSFLRSVGFRRVGVSEWFAYINRDRHPSRCLSAVQDYDTPEPLHQLASGQIQDILDALSNPMTSSILCAEKVRELDASELETTVVNSRDKSGNTILHLAAINRRLEALTVILSNFPGLADIRNLDGYTPVEALESLMEEHRSGEMLETSDKFKGFAIADIECVAVLTGTTAFDLTQLNHDNISAIASATEEEWRPLAERQSILDTLRLKYGCNCGQCIGGFISPRMKFSLECKAEIEHKEMDDWLELDGPNWVEGNKAYLTYLDEGVRENLKTNQSMRQGFTNIWNHFAKCLSKGRVPNERNILHLWRRETREWPPVTKNYLDRGGTVAAIATQTFESAMKDDDWAGFGGLTCYFEEDIEKLPVCRNDHEFGFVSAMCGFKRVSMVRYIDSRGQEIER